MTDPNQTPTPAEALEAIRRSRAKVADQAAKGSWSYDFKYAALVGGLVAAQGLPFPWQLPATGAFVLALVLLLRGWVRQTGMMVTGLTPRRARWVAIGLGLVLGAVMVGVLFLTRKTGMWQIPVAGGVIGAILGLAGSRLWWAVYRDEMGAGR